MRKNITLPGDMFILIVLLTLMIMSLSFVPLKMYKENYFQICQKIGE